MKIEKKEESHKGLPMKKIFTRETDIFQTIPIVYKNVLHKPFFFILTLCKEVSMIHVMLKRMILFHLILKGV
jgi:hypothetical protein